MIITGSCTLSLVLPPEDRVLWVVLRVVQGLSYGLSLGAGFSHGHAAALDWALGRGFGPSIVSRYIVFRL